MLLHDEEGNILKDAYPSLIAFFTNMGSYVLSLKFDEAKALADMETAFNKHPELKEDYLSPYFRLLSQVKKEKASEIIGKHIEEIKSKESLSKADYKNLMYAHYSIKDREGYQNYLKQLIKAYPTSDEAINEAFYKVYRENDPDKKVALYDSLMTIYPKKSQQHIMNNITHTYIKEKNWDAIIEFFDKHQNHLSNHEYNDAAWHMAEKGGDLAIAEDFARKAVTLAHNLSVDDKNIYRSNNDFEESKHHSLGHKYHTLGFVLMQQERYEEALPELRKSLDHHKEKQEYINARYLQALFKAQKYEEVISEGERLIAEAKSNQDLVETYKEAWAMSNRAEEGLEIKLAALHKNALQLKKARILEKMILEKAPEFTLKNMNGEIISSQNLLGKTLVVDFWATWCGPCIQSFPAMDQAVKKFKDDSGTAFLFINTREDGEDRQKKISDLMTKKNLAWEILLDEEDKTVKAFNVNGIPTKFVIDPEGNIRFKSVGYSGNKEKSVEELALMIELSKEAQLANK